MDFKVKWSYSVEFNCEQTSHFYIQTCEKHFPPYLKVNEYRAKYRYYTYFWPYHPALSI